MSTDQRLEDMRDILTDSELLELVWSLLDDEEQERLTTGIKAIYDEVE